jgi:glycosyltransferase involved in cell wall biosynthesis
VAYPVKASPGYTVVMKVVIEAVQDSPYVTGTDRVAYNVLRELQALDNKNQYLVICSLDYDYIPSSVQAKNFRIIYRRQWKGRIMRRFDMATEPLRDLYYRWVVRPDVHYVIRNLGGPRIKFAPLVMNALDIIPLVYPKQYFGRQADEQRYLDESKRVAGMADRLVAISEQTKRDVVKYLEVPAEKVEVALLAAEPKFRPVKDRETLAAVGKRYKLPRRFALTIGSNEPRKNVRTALKAYQLLPKSVRSEVEMVVLGGAWKHGNGDKLKDLGGVSFTGFVEDDDLPVIYNAAEAFVFLSTYEGFGLPPLEAMACGTPVVSSNATSLPEVTGSAAALVEPDDAEGAARALGRILNDPEEARRLSSAGLARAGQFTWRRTAEKILSVLEEVGSHE